MSKCYETFLRLYVFPIITYSMDSCIKWGCTSIGTPNACRQTVGFLCLPWEYFTISWNMCWCFTPLGSPWVKNSTTFSFMKYTESQYLLHVLRLVSTEINASDSSSDYKVASTDRMIVNNTLERKKWWPNLRYYPRTFLEGLRRTTKPHSM
jgi:hypothetical protein